MRRALFASALAAVMIALPGAAHAQGPSGWVYARAVVASPDGAHLYAAGGKTLTFSIGGDGGLTLLDNSQPGSFTNATLAMSPDGRFLYEGFGGNSTASGITIFSRDPATGLLTHETTFKGGPGTGVALQPITSVTVSPDGGQLYVTQRQDDAIHVFDRDPETGMLAVRQSLYAGPGDELPGTGQLSGFALSPDGRFAYLAGDAQTVLRRDPATGTLNFVQNAQGSSNAFAIAVAPDGRRVYAGMTNYNVFDRDPEAGTLTYRSRPLLGDGGDRCFCDGRSIAVSPDSSTVFSVDSEGQALLQARVTPDSVELAHRYRDGVDGIHGLATPRALAVTPDGRFLAVASESSYLGGPPTGGNVSLYRLGGDRLTLASSVESIKVPSYPLRPIRPAISINDGAIYTNDPNVTVSVTTPPGVASFRLGNDPAVFPFRATRANADGHYPWQLSGTGGARDVRRVHVRFTPNESGSGPDLFDDIILDQRPPAVLSAKLSRARLVLRARDNRSGVRGLHITANRKKPGRQRRFSRTVKVNGRARKLYVRVVDGAGNPSKWKTVRAR